MRLSGTTLQLSASDLSHFLACRHRTALDLAVARGLRVAPSWVDPAVAALQQRGLEHERRYVDRLRGEGFKVVDLSATKNEQAIARSVAAMKDGADVIVQPALADERWFGRPDLLRRVSSPSAFGVWSYEVYDTKLAKETRGGTVLQLSLYCHLLTATQGAEPEFFHVVTPDVSKPVKTFRVGDFSAYFRFIRDRLDRTSRRAPDEIAAENYPEPVEHCQVCRWWKACDERRRADDHLSLVAGISRQQSRDLKEAGVATLAALGSLPLPLPFVPRRGAAETYVRIREQARVQLAGRTQNALVHELLPILPERGLTRLPEPSPGDVFLDLEGDPFARDGGREYLFGFIVGDEGAPYRKRWAYSDRDERASFEAVVDAVLAEWARHPTMHVYHYAPYEPAAFKRLMGRYSTREAEVDRMLRAELFVDLYAVVRHALRASVERYSIKDLEPFYGFERAVPLEDARSNLRIVERALDLGATQAITANVRAQVEGYNRDDCVSVVRLRAWLETARTTVEHAGTSVPRPAPPPPPPVQEVSPRAQRVQQLVAALTADVPPDAIERTDEEHGRWLLAHMLEWHRREAKAPWWEFFRLRDLTEDELFEERAAVAGLTLVERVGGTQRSPVDRYAFPPQEVEIAEGDLLHLPDGTDFGSVEAIDVVGQTIDVKKRGAHADAHPRAVFAHSLVNSDVLADALLRIAEEVSQRGMPGVRDHLAAREILVRRAPRLRQGLFRPNEGESAHGFASRVIVDLAESVLPIQGPPGAGKTHVGAQMICELVRRGMRVGVTAVSHKVIRNLLDRSASLAAKAGVPLKAAHKVTTKGPQTGPVEEATDNASVLNRLGHGRLQVVGGTAWLWARPDAHKVVDVLFVDEAGQMALANAVAVSQAAPRLVLLGDPQQLEQPQQGSHPDGTNVSALEHLLAGKKTVPADRGIFLPETWRLPPAICAFTSELFYEWRLRARPGLERQTLVADGAFDGNGLWLAMVEHDGNQSASREEVAVVRRLVAQFLSDGVTWTDGDGRQHPISPHDILVIAPYNAQVALLGEHLEPLRVRVGTVDRFQGQEAPVVIYSMATSSPEDAPHGMEFLYSPNRLNVATSRARCVCVLVANPRLFQPDCSSARQMQLANAFCRYAELAKVVPALSDARPSEEP